MKQVHGNSLLQRKTHNRMELIGVLQLAGFASPLKKADLYLARKLANEYICDLRKNDLRKGGEYGAPYECFHPSGHKQNPVYMTTVTCPFYCFPIDGSRTIDLNN
jgi:hypothetical protein